MPQASATNATAHVIVAYSEHNASTFSEIFVPWLKAMTGKEPEPEDIVAVQNPFDFYFRDGGAVFFGYMDGEAVGCVAVKKLENGLYEFGKLVVQEKARGTGLGKALVEHCIDFVRKEGGEKILLQTFNKLEVAIGMYKRMGFEPIKPPSSMQVLSRTEIVMGMEIRNSTFERFSTETI